MKPQLITILILTLLFSINAFGQQTNQWRGLVLDQATPEQAMETLGKPKADKPAAKFRPMKYDEWFDYKNRTFRTLEFDKIEGFSKVKLFFLEGTLRAIELSPKKLEASLVSKSYGVDFESILPGGLSNVASGRLATDNRVNRSIEFPTVYYLMHKAELSYIFVLVDNVSLRSTLGTVLVGPMDDVNSVPGKAGVIQLLSVSLETTKGSDLLK
jgi:hypothetical protein